MDFYNLFSYSAKKAIYRASGICTQFKNKYLEPEHIFYSLLNLRSCSAVEVLHKLGVNLPKLIYSLEAYLYEHVGSYKGQASFSARTLALLDLSFKEVKRFHHREIGTTHLLLALAQDRAPFLRQLFEEHGLDSKKLRDTFLAHAKSFRHSGEGPLERYEQMDKLLTSLFDFAKVTNLDSQIASLCSTPLLLALAIGFGMAWRLRAPELTPRHVLFGLLAYPHSPGTTLLDKLGADAGGLVKRVVAEMEQGTTPPAELRLSAGCAELFGQAFRLMLDHRQPLIDLPQLLLAFQYIEDDGLQQLLAEHGVNLALCAKLFGIPAPPGASLDDALASALEKSAAKSTEAEVRPAIAEEESGSPSDDDTAPPQPDAADETPPAGS